MNPVRILTVSAIWLSSVVAIAYAEPEVQAMSNAQLITLVPPADEWREVSPVTTEIRRRILAGRLTDDDWRSLLVRSKVIYARTSWPADRPLAIGLAYPVWLTDLQGSVSVRARLPDAKEVSAFQTWGGCALGNDAERARQRYMEVGVLPPETSAVEFDVEFRTTSDSKTPNWAGTITIPVRSVAAPEDGLVGVSDAKFDAAIRESLVVEVTHDQGEQPAQHLWVFFQPARAAINLDADMGVHLNVTILHENRIVGRMHPVEVEWKADSIALFGGRVEGLSPLQVSDPAFVGSLTVSILPDRAAAFRDIKHPKHWSGTMVVPVKEVLNRTTVKPRTIDRP